ncbi:MAG: hypothetical protein A4S09_00610 [Proteobacteria bacterium SG_bin7]|nr:MAG: hypothetical protein A4S09_00610 [Proteobacteria bacterium SG_bin7]
MRLRSLTQWSVATTILVFFQLAYSGQNYLRDVVLVPSDKPFYISIFEATTNDVRVAALTFSEADHYCSRLGMRLPTRDEWFQAASGLGKNKNFTLKEDALTAANRFHYNANSSVGVYDSQRLGIDIFGTVGMSGNRSEWVVNPDGTRGQCGWKYTLRNADDFRLNVICGDKKSTGWADDNVTVRCVADYRPETRVELSQNVKGEHANYLAELVRTAENNQINSQPEQPNQQEEQVPQAKPRLDDEF